jgi:hypothetical protein
MSAGRNSEAAAIASLALAFRHSPARHADLLHGVAPLPPSINILLRLAGGTAPHELSPALESLATADELRTATLFFIEQVLFQRDASHYRVLGLNQGAAPEQIKEHHRLLMRLFHPDRESQADERREQFATRANLAYNTLRDADQRSSYDATLKPSPAAAFGQAPRRPPGVVRRRMPEPESFWTVRVYPLLMRYLPQWVLAGTALVSVSVVGAVYLFNPPVHLPQPAALTSAAAVAEKPVLSADVPDTADYVAVADAMPPDEMAEQFERKIIAAGQALSATVSPAEGVVEPPVPAPVKAVEPAPITSAPVTISKAVPATPAGNAQKAAAAAAMPEPSRPAVTPAASHLPVNEPTRPAVAAAVPAPTPATEPPPPALPDPNTLLTRFLAAYERGDMQACMALLDEAVRTDAGGKSDIRRDYDTLFRTTDLRHITVTSMTWSREGDSIRGEGQYRATLMRKGETLLRTQGGQIRIELVRRGGMALINELYYLANSRS